MKVRVREVWDARIFDTASKMARQVNGKPASRPIQSIYEIMRYNSMSAVTTNGLYSADNKAMSQDYYYYNPKTAENTKKRVRGW
jgi:hypothetical protein